MEKPAVHLIGVSGTGLSAIARVLLERGYSVSGSDRVLSPQAEELRADGVHIAIGHRPENIAGADLVVRSSAVRDDNPEVLAARQAGIPVLKRSDFLGQLMLENRVVAVAGTHGKTTTTAMLAWTLTALGEDPTYIIGGVANNLGTNAHAGAGREFVIEADEYDNMFLGLAPDVAIVTNLEYDHPDFFPTPQAFYQAFLAFARRIKPGGCLVVCQDDPGAGALAKEVTPASQVLTYGLDAAGDRPAPDYQAAQLEVNANGGYSFTILRRGALQALVDLQVPGVHNVRNALACLAALDALGKPLDEAGRALNAYQGAGRRFELRGEFNGAPVIDDYAHHPSEIGATLAAARTRYPSKAIWAVWQPHTYSRLLALEKDYLGAFADADHLVVTEVYGAREQPPQGFSTQEWVGRIRHPDVRFIPDMEQVVAVLRKELSAETVLLVLSAGDADRIGRELTG
ncbi:MAG: UDP-N-acetylmuramate--L-alanine ligase [Anaerolineales bacterium]|nr:UDP-N-acetylmuramate--L-alanine ligase [Anaerolineales bacterium]